jgi:hypothetical protein
VAALVRGRASDRRDAPNERREVIEGTAAEARHLLRTQAAQVTLQRLRPQAERGRLAQRIGTRRKGDCSAASPCEKLACETRLADPGIGKQQDGAELSRGGSPVLALKSRDRGIAANERVAQGMAVRFMRQLPLRAISSRREPVYRNSCTCSSGSPIVPCIGGSPRRRSRGQLNLADRFAATYGWPAVNIRWALV